MSVSRDFSAVTFPLSRFVPLGGWIMRRRFCWPSAGSRVRRATETHGVNGHLSFESAPIRVLPFSCSPLERSERSKQGRRKVAISFQSSRIWGWWLIARRRVFLKFSSQRGFLDGLLGIPSFTFDLHKVSLGFSSQPFGYDHVADLHRD